VARFILQHRHGPDECPAAFTAWLGFESPLRKRSVPCTCLSGGHAIWWMVEAASALQALALLPGFVAARTEAIQVRDVDIP
jgi:hypothetical protein